MPTQAPLPHLLQPYLFPSQSSLTLLTSTLGASTNWLVLRFIYAALKSKSGPKAGIEDEDATRHRKETKVVLASWLRDASSWKDGARKLGIDLQAITFVDGLSTGLALSAGQGIAEVEKVLLKAVENAKATDSSVLLVLDGLDFLLAATTHSALSITDMTLELREHTHSIIITAATDGPLTQSPSTPLEIGHAAFVMRMVHQAALVMSVRELDTGVAKDVSGVLRITRGSGDWRDGSASEDTECLFLVGGEGSVKVFERGGS